jgi:hypothetical protein
MKNSFATRVFVKRTPRGASNTLAEHLRKELQKQINRYKVSINRKVFVKTPEEKAKLKIAKAEWKKRQDILTKS